EVVLGGVEPHPGEQRAAVGGAPVVGLVMVPQQHQLGGGGLSAQATSSAPGRVLPTDTLVFRAGSHVHALAEPSRARARRDDAVVWEHTSRRSNAAMDREGRRGVNVISGTEH